MTEDLFRRLGFERTPADVRDRSVGDLTRLDGRVALVTGGGGLGLGRAIVDRLASQGARLVVADKNLAGARTTAEVVGGKWKVEALAVECDVTDVQSVHAMVDSAVQAFGRLDVLINDVGGGGPRGPLVTNTTEAIEAGVRLNLVSQILCTQAALKPMIEQRSGSIVCVASEGGKGGMPGLVVYNACKAGLIGFVRNIVHEVSQYGIRVNAVCPGIMLVDHMHERVRSSPPGGPATATLEFALDRVPMERGCLPEEVANVVGFLASDAASYVQGAAYSVGGGQTA